jgi:hypothetical protein
VVKRKVRELVIGTTREISARTSMSAKDDRSGCGSERAKLIPALPRDQKKRTEPHMLSKNGIRYCTNKQTNKQTN